MMCEFCIQSHAKILNLAWSKIIYMKINNNLEREYGYNTSDCRDRRFGNWFDDWSEPQSKGRERNLWQCTITAAKQRFGTGKGRRGHVPWNASVLISFPVWLAHSMDRGDFDGRFNLRLCWGHGIPVHDWVVDRGHRWLGLGSLYTVEAGNRAACQNAGLELTKLRLQPKGAQQ